MAQPRKGIAQETQKGVADGILRCAALAKVVQLFQVVPQPLGKIVHALPLSSSGFPQRLYRSARTSLSPSRSGCIAERRGISSSGRASNHPFRAVALNYPDASAGAVPVTVPPCPPRDRIGDICTISAWMLPIPYRSFCRPCSAGFAPRLASRRRHSGSAGRPSPPNRTRSFSRRPDPAKRWPPSSPASMRCGGNRRFRAASACCTSRP